MDVTEFDADDIITTSGWTQGNEAPEFNSTGDDYINFGG
jgi:hypothetical protein